jgi:hypothetical protein
MIARMTNARAGAMQTRRCGSPPPAERWGGVGGGGAYAFASTPHPGSRCSPTLPTTRFARRGRVARRAFRMSHQVLAATTAALLLLGSSAFAAQPVRRVAIDVQPYYEAARKPDAPPKVSVGRTFDAILSSVKREDIVAARDAVEANPQNVTPMTLMVLAIRLYDVGLRDDAVFWFYVAKARYTTLEDVVDVKAAGLSDTGGAVKNFAVLAGPFINGYAFCDPAKQHAIVGKAIDWVEAHPYAVVFLSGLPGKPGDRAANLGQSIKTQRARAAQEHAQLSEPKFAAQFAKARSRNKAETLFCWK